MNRILRFAALCALLTLAGGLAPARAADAVPAASAAPAGETAPKLCLDQQILCESDGTYTLTLQAWAETGAPAPGPSSELRYTLAPEYAMTEQTKIQVYALDKTYSGWGQVKLDLPGLQLSTDAATGTLSVTGFDYTTNAVSLKPRLGAGGRSTFGRRLVVRVCGLRADYAATYGGCGVSAGSGGVYLAGDDGTQPVCCATFPAAAADIPLRCAYAPADQTLTAEQEVNFGYMINPPGGSAGSMPDGHNNAWCTVRYTVSDAEGPVAEYTVPAGTAVSGGSWTLWPGDSFRAPAEFTVTVTLCAVKDPAGDPPPQGSAQRLVLQSRAQAEAA